MTQRVLMTSVDGELGAALFDDGYIQDPYPLYAEMHRRGPVHPIGAGFHAVSSWAAVSEAVTRTDDFSNNLTGTMTYSTTSGVELFSMGEMGGPTSVLATADGPAHAAHRKTLTRRLAARRVRDMEPLVLDTAGSMMADGLAHGTIEWMGDVADTLPMLIVGRLIGVPDADAGTLARWGYAATQMVEGLVTREQLDAAGVSVMELFAYVQHTFRQASADPRDDLLGDLVGACADGTVDELTALIMMVTLFSAGGESTASLIGSAAWVLATRPDLQEQLREDPDQVGSFVEEVLRYESPFRGHYRHVVRDTELAGVALPAGSRLLLLWGAANRDPEQFENADDIVLDRPAARAHMAFGSGVHLCVGASLARMEAQVVIGHLLQNTTDVSCLDTGPWLPSLLVRRLEHLRLTVR